MAEQQDTTTNPKIWISYPWVNREERDFAYLTKQLANEKFEAVYDSIRIMPNQRLAKRIVQRLQSIGFNGWMYVLTHQCVTQREYINELTAAISQTKLHMGAHFPMIGLTYGIAPYNLPPMLRVLPCVSLGDSDWDGRVREIINKNSLKSSQPTDRKESRFVWKIHRKFRGNPSLTAIEVLSRGETIRNWRFAIPKSCPVVRWGQGPSGGTSFSKAQLGEVTGYGKYNTNEVFWFGAADTVSNSESAYVLFRGTLPDFICFGPSYSSQGIPSRMEIFWPIREMNTNNGPSEAKNM